MLEKKSLPTHHWVNSFSKWITNLRLLVLQHRRWTWSNRTKALQIWAIYISNRIKFNRFEQIPTKLPFKWGLFGFGSLEFVQISSTLLKLLWSWHGICAQPQKIIVPLNHVVINAGKWIGDEKHCKNTSSWWTTLRLRAFKPCNQWEMIYLLNWCRILFVNSLVPEKWWLARFLVVVVVILNFWDTSFLILIHEHERMPPNKVLTNQQPW